jgi:hypothetical protein
VEDAKVLDNVLARQIILLVDPTYRDIGRNAEIIMATLRDQNVPPEVEYN